MRLLECGHSLHSACFDAFIASLTEIDQPESLRVCPVCRHPLNIMNTEYRHALSGTVDRAASDGYQSAADSAASQPVPETEAEDMFPWWRAQTGQVFHTAT